MLDREGRPSRIDGKVIVLAEGPALKRLRETQFDEKRCEYLEGGRFHLLDLARGMANIRLQPKEVFPFQVEFASTEDVSDFAVRVVQYIDVDGVDEVLGGQTFVVGKVRGFPTVD